MKTKIEKRDFIEASLGKREEQGLLRQLLHNEGLVDFCSNDYLGFARSEELAGRIQSRLADISNNYNGSTGSRLISGNSEFTEDLETAIAAYHRAEAGLIFNSGYDANIGLFSSVPQRGDTVLYEELSHASIIDGIRLGFADSFKFRHNDTRHLEERLKAARGNVFVAVESVY